MESTEKVKSRWQTLQDNLEDRPTWNQDGDCRKQVYLQLISSMHEQHRMLSSLIDLKNLVNHNEGKITVIRAKVHGISGVDHPSMSDSKIDLEIEELEDKIKDAEEESYDLDTEINGMRTKTGTVEREIKRSYTGIDVEGIDEAIRNAKRQIGQLEDML